MQTVPSQKREGGRADRQGRQPPAIVHQSNLQLRQLLVQLSDFRFDLACLHSLWLQCMAGDFSKIIGKQNTPGLLPW